jgi:hypothetical protein
VTTAQAHVTSNLAVSNHSSRRPSAEKNSEAHSGNPLLDARDKKHRGPPPVPAHPHRNTYVPTVSEDFDLTKLANEAFQLDADGGIDESATALKSRPLTLYKALKDDQNDEEEEYNTNFPPENDVVETDLALILYSYAGRSADDLPVATGDILKVVAIEGEWLYGVMLGNKDGIIEEIEQDQKLGWVPLTFTMPIANLQDARQILSEV